MNKKTILDNKFIIILSVISLISITPIVDAITEPSIIIEMFSGQTTNPFEIKDTSGTDIFTVNARGDYISDSNPQRFNVAMDNTDITIATTDTTTNPQFIWRIDINRNGESQIQWHRGDTQITGEGRRDSGTGTCTAGWIVSVDNGATWTNGISPSPFTFASYTNIFTNSGATNFGSTITNFGFGFFNSDGATTCSVKNLTSHFKVYKPIEWTFTVVTSP